VTAAARRVLADGQWHTESELRHAMIAVIRDHHALHLFDDYAKRPTSHRHGFDPGMGYHDRLSHARRFICARALTAMAGPGANRPVVRRTDGDTTYYWEPPRVMADTNLKQCAPGGEHRTVRLDSVTRDPALQCRARRDAATAARYAAAMGAGEHLPPVVLVEDEKSGTRWLADGHYRCDAAELLGREEIEAYVVPGTFYTAKRIAWGANERNGCGRAEEDRRLAVKNALADPDVLLRGLTRSQVAAICGVTLEQLEAYCRDDLATLDAVDRATQRKPGNPTGANQHTPKVEGGTVDNVHSSSKGRPTGNSRDAFLRRLREGAPEIHARVVAGEITPHQGMVEAGFKRKPTPAEIILREWRKLSDEEQAELLARLTGRPSDASEAA
jgi:hypothetical protein